MKMIHKDDLNYNIVSDCRLGIHIQLSKIHLNAIYFLVINP